ncbi:glycosyltransferase family 2 protein [Nakamurella endophytica]|uniref:Glycosyltransferase 2-like domain-containing protein n=1 Tax=Nakamurella endophytica TaxID=1748367 RepID=A0A917WG99_9ACTN|nr:glycosyltransferase family 2 protein [Nakamurella endophytica]GGM01500.1 hypothetical protein GCM10011594_21940 [Nakamurella endophytica]
MSPFVSFLSVLRSPAALVPMLASLDAQDDVDWQWCVVAAPDAEPGTGAAVVGLAAAHDRVRGLDGAAVAAADVPAAAAELASGAHLSWLPESATLDPGAVAALRRGLARAEWVYTDESVRGEAGNPTGVWLKPDWSPELLRSQPYALYLAAVPAAVAAAVGGFRRSSPAPWYDLVLRVSEVAGAPAHVPGPYLVRATPSSLPAGGRLRPPYVDDPAAARCAVVAEHCARVGIAVDEVSPVEVGGQAVGQRVHRRPGRRPRVSVVIPTRGGSSLTHGFPRRHVAELVDGLSRPGGYPDLEIVVVHDEATPPAVLDQIDKVTSGHWTSLQFHGPFHFSRKCNAGALVATGEYLCFLNDDMDVVDPGWLAELADLLDDPEVGAVGPRLLFADGTLQHAGHVYNGGSPGHLLFGEPADSLDLGGAAQLTGERSGVTGACLLMRADVFARVGGFSELFPLNFNDVDLCLKIRAEGLRIVYTPWSTLYHYESQTRVPKVGEVEMQRIQRRWLYQLETDPYWNEMLRPRPHGPVLNLG